MKKQNGRIYLRANSENKAKVDALCARQGVDLSGLLNAFLDDCAKRNHLPLPYVAQVRAKRKRRERLLTFEEIQNAVKEAALGYSKEEIKKVYLFGSYSRDEAKVKSDVDILIEPGPNLSLLREGEFNEILRELLHKSVDTLTTEDVLEPEIRENINKDRRLIYER